MSDFTSIVAEKVNEGILNELHGNEATIGSRVKDDLCTYPMNQYPTLSVLTGFSFRLARKELFDGKLFLVFEHKMEYDVATRVVVKNLYRVRANDEISSTFVSKADVECALSSVLTSFLNTHGSDSLVSRDVLASYSFEDSLHAYEVEVQDNIH